MNKKINFKDYISKKLLIYKIVLPATLSLITAIAAGYFVTVFYSENNLSFTLNHLSQRKKRFLYYSF